MNTDTATDLITVTFVDFGDGIVIADNPEDAHLAAKGRDNAHALRACIYLGVEPHHSGGHALIAGFNDGRQWNQRHATLDSALARMGQLMHMG